MDRLEGIIRGRVIELEEKIHIKKNADFCNIEISLEDLESMLKVNKDWLMEFDEAYKDYH